MHERLWSGFTFHLAKLFKLFNRQSLNGYTRQITKRNEHHLLYLANDIIQLIATGFFYVFGVAAHRGATRQDYID
ncbi:MAG TPA: hypothetical protein VF177_00805 [Anaerolineae bacterium]